DLQVAGGVVAFSDDVERLIGPRKPGLPFTLGAMGSRTHNFYNDVYRRAGYEDIAREVQDLCFNRQREEAAARIPDELVLKTNLIGTEDMVRECIRIHQAVVFLQTTPCDCFSRIPFRFRPPRWATREMQGKKREKPVMWQSMMGFLLPISALT